MFLLLTGCFAIHPSNGGGELGVEPEETPPKRTVNAEDVVLPQGYHIEAVATGLNLPSGVTFDDGGHIFVLEAGYSYGEIFTTPRIVEVTGGRIEEVIAGKNPPWTGMTWSEGAFYIAEGGAVEGGRIVRYGADKTPQVLVEGLPSLGDHHTNGPVIGPDGQVYFGQGTATNAAVVGIDAAEFGWLDRHPDFHDVPCKDVKVNAENFETEDPLHPEGPKVETGPYSAFGTPVTAGQVIPGRVPCNGAVMKVSREGGTPELVAWGFRNPFGLAFSPSGTLYVSDNGYDVRGSRPVFGAGDWLWKVEPGGWYGWPDFVEGLPMEKRHKAPGHPRPEAVLAEKPGSPPKPAALLGVHASADGFDFSREAAFGHVGDAFIALFGDMAPGVGKVMSPVGFRVMRVEVDSGLVEEFVANRGDKTGPASWLGTGGLERPVAARFDPSGNSLYIVDFGLLLTGPEGPRAIEKTGVLWRVWKEEG